MKFIQLPVSGTLVNVDEILTLDHEVKDSKTTVVCWLGHHHRLVLNGRDAEYLVSFCQEEVYE
jgi:hypothetical protein